MLGRGAGEHRAGWEPTGTGQTLSDKNREQQGPTKVQRPSHFLPVPSVRHVLPVLSSVGTRPESPHHTFNVWGGHTCP